MTVTTSGPEPDQDGYRVRVDDVTSQGLGLEDSAAFEVAPGSHSVTLGDLAGNCAVSDDSTRNLTVAAGVTEEVAFQVTCTATGALRVRTRSEGTLADPDGYQVQVPGRELLPIGPNQTITMTGLPPGPLEVDLTGLAETCSTVDTATRMVTLVAGDTVEVSFQVTCAPSPPANGTIVVTVRTQTVNAPMPTGYILTLDGGRSTSVAATQSVTLADVPAGMHSVELSGLPPWCMAGSGGFPGVNPVQVSVTGRSVTKVVFGVLCLG